MDPRTRELAALQALGLAVSESLLIERISEAALRGIFVAVQPDMVVLFLRDGERLILQGMLPPEARQRLGAIPPHRVGECICGLAVREAKPIFSLDIHNDQRCTWEECKRAGIRSFAAQPLRSGEEIIGVIGLASLTERDFEAHAGFLDALSRQVSVGLANARRYDALRREVAEREKVEKELRASENRFATVFRASPVCTSLTRLSDGHFLDINDAFLRLFGYDREEVVGRNPLILNMWANPDDRARMVESLRKSGRHDGFETTFRTKSGEIRNVMVVSEVVYVAGEQYILGLTHDITDRKRAEEAMRRSEEKSRLVIDNASDGIVIAQDGLILFANPRALGFVGMPSEKIVGFPFARLIHPEDREMVGQYHIKRMRGEQVPEGYLFRIIGPGGDITWLENRAVITLWEGKPASLNFLRDVTQQKQLEEELAQSRKMEAVGRLAGGIAHDFNNLLTAIIGYSNLIMQQIGDNEPVRAELMEIQKSAERAANLTRQLLAYSRKQVLQPKVVSLNGIVRGIDSLLRRLLGEDIDLSTILEKDVALVEVDRAQIEQIIVNLSVNARDAMPRGGKLKIETKNVELGDPFARQHLSLVPGPHVELSITDTGAGMDPETMSKIFEPFFTTKAQGKGTGLGLSMVYGIVNQSKGHIDIESSPGRGTTFRVYFRKVDAVEPVAVESRSEDTRGGTETVLVVEDEPAVQRLVRNTLAHYGYKILAAARGEEAVRIYREYNGPIHLLLTDVVMPGGSGRDLSERITADRPGIKVLFMSGYTDDVIGLHGVLEEGIHFIEKPFSPASLAKKVRCVLDTA